MSVWLFRRSGAACSCSPGLVSKYQKRLSGPLLDRIDIHVEVPRVPFQKLSDDRQRRGVRDDPGTRGGGAGAATDGALSRARRVRARAGSAGLLRGSLAPADLQRGHGPHPGTRTLPGRPDGPPAAGGRDAPDEPDTRGPTIASLSCAHDRGPRGGRADHARAPGGGDPVPAETAGMTGQSGYGVMLVFWPTPIWVQVEGVQETSLQSIGSLPRCG